MKRAIVILIVVVLIPSLDPLPFLKIAARGFSAREDPTATEKFLARTVRIRITTRRSPERSFRSSAIDGAQRESADGGT
jgi:hypothetical protein